MSKIKIKIPVAEPQLDKEELKNVIEALKKWLDIFKRKIYQPI